jgi:glucose-1-phosphatase
MTIQAVIFDLGGVLLRTEDPTPRRQLAETLGLPYEELYRLVFDSDSAVKATVGKVSTESHWESVRAGLNLPEKEFQGQIEKLRDDFFGGDYLDTGLVDYIRSLRPRFKTGLLSNAWDDLRRLMEDKWKINDAFDEIIISAEVGIAKPDPRIYRLAVDRLGVDPEQAVFIDDFFHNLEAARSVGLATVHFKVREQALAELNSLLEQD